MDISSNQSAWRRLCKWVKSRYTTSVQPSPSPSLSPRKELPTHHKSAGNPLPKELRFPKPPWRIDQSLLDSAPAMHAVIGYLERVRAWHSAVLEFIAKCS